MKSIALLVAVVILACLAGAAPARADEVYLKLTGLKTRGKSLPGGWGDSNCYGTLRGAMAAMAGGDTLVIDDGTYTTEANSIDRYFHPPSGSPEAFTVVRARHIPGTERVAVHQPCLVRFDGRSGAVFDDDGTLNQVHHVKFWGIKWDGVGLPDGWNHLYFKQCAFQGVRDGNTAALSLSGRSNLVEDCVFYGKGRYKVLFYDISRSGIYGSNLCRRCVARHDWAKKEDPTPDPIATFVSYLNRGSAFLNCIDIDSNLPAYWMNNPGEFNGAFSQPVDDSQSGPHSMLVQGSIVINSAMGLGWGASPGPGVKNANNQYRDVVGAKVAGGINLRGGGSVSGLTLLEVGRKNFSYRSVRQRSQILQGDEGVNSWDNGVTVINAILRGIAGAPIKGSATGDYLNIFRCGAGGETPRHQVNGDPYMKGLKYLVRVEKGTALASGGRGGAQMGARIVNRLGRDGTFKGEPQWDTEQGPLWPWPLEEWVQAEMRSSDYRGFCEPYAGTTGACPPSFGTDAQRGFAAQGESLTGYIWRFLGHPVPSDLSIWSGWPASSLPPLR